MCIYEADGECKISNEKCIHFLANTNMAPLLCLPMCV